MIMFHFFMRDSCFQCMSSSRQTAAPDGIVVTGSPHFEFHAEFQKCLDVDFGVAFEAGFHVTTRAPEPLEARIKPRADVVEVLDVLGDAQRRRALIWRELDLSECCVGREGEGKCGSKRGRQAIPANRNHSSTFGYYFAGTSCASFKVRRISWSFSI